MNIVDGHLHFFALEAGDYHWLKPQNPPYWQDKQAIALSCDERSLTLSSGHTLAGYVHVEAGFDNERPWREIRYLEQRAQLPFKSVASIDLCSERALSDIQTLAGFSSVAGLRHILDEQASFILTHPKTKHALKLSSEYGLSFDAQLDVGDGKAVSALLRLLEALPALSVVINHAGSSLLGSAVTATYIKQWRINMKVLAQCPRVAVKLSGWEMQCRDWHWRSAQNVVVETVAIFGVSRVMLASNFPLSNWRHSYQALWLQYEKMLAQFTFDEKCSLLANNTARWYGLDI